MADDLMTSDTEFLRDVEKRVRATICNTYSSDGNCRVEGRISEDDFNRLLDLINKLGAEVSRQWLMR